MYHLTGEQLIQSMKDFWQKQYIRAERRRRERWKWVVCERFLPSCPHLFNWKWNSTSSTLNYAKYVSDSSWQWHLTRITVSGILLHRFPGGTEMPNFSAQTKKKRMLFFYSAFDFPAMDQPLWIIPFKSCCWRRERDFSSSQKQASYLFIFIKLIQTKEEFVIPVPLLHGDCLKGREIKRERRGSRGGAARRWTDSRIGARKDEAAT